LRISLDRKIQMVRGPAATFNVGEANQKKAWEENDSIIEA
jgi:hypothetical protein